MDQAKQKILKGPRFFNRPGLADEMGIGLVTLDKLLRREVNPIPSLRVGHKILIPCDQFEAWVASEGSKGHAGWDR
jgi:hypothetical protein